MQSAPSQPAVRLLAISSVLVLSALAGAALFWRGSAAVRVDVLAADDPVAIGDAEINAQFGLRNPVIWVVAPRRGTIWSSAVLEHVRDLTRSALRIPGVLATEVMSIASPNVRDMVVSEEAMGSTYLMAELPRTANELTELRRRVEGNPSFRGTLVSNDGRAAMVLADFRNEADVERIATEALRLRDAHRDADTEVWVAGAPVLVRQVSNELWRLALMTGTVVAVGCLAFAAVAGMPALAVAAAATAAAVLWTVAALAIVNAVFIPWVTQIALPLVGITTALTRAPDRISQGRVALAIAVGFAALAIVAQGPARALGLAGFVGTAAAFSAVRLIAPPVGPSTRSYSFRHWWREPALLVLLFCLLGLAALRGSFATFGYGARYLPEMAAQDLRAIGRLLPPPTSLVVRARGPVDFVKAPEVLQGIDRLADRARGDRATVRAMSLADLVKMVNQAFNEGLAEYHAIPADALTIGRQITMAYSPGFRRFVDRSLSSTALWVNVEGDDPVDLARVRAALEREIETLHWPSVDIKITGGDGAVALRTAELAGSVTLGWLAFALAAAAVIAVSCGFALALRALTGACAGAAICCGLYGWLGVPIDLVALAGIGSATVFGWVCTALGSRIDFAAAMAACALAALLFSHLAGSLLGYAFAAPLIVPLLVGALLPTAGLVPRTADHGTGYKPKG